MAFSFTDYTGNGSQTLWTVPFSFLNRSHVSVINLADNSNITFTWVNDSQIQITPALAGSINFRVKRTTSIVNRDVDFVNGTGLGEADLDSMNLQLFYSLQETDDNNNNKLAVPDSSLNGLTLPPATAEKYIRWNSTATALENADAIGPTGGTGPAGADGLWSGNEDTVLPELTDLIPLQDRSDSDNPKFALISAILDLVEPSEVGDYMYSARATKTGHWEICDGGALDSVAHPEYAALYALIGTTFGGTGPADFNKPDFRGRVPVGVGNAFGLTNRVAGAVGGSEDAIVVGHTHGTSSLSTNSAGNHSHTQRRGVDTGVGVTVVTPFTNVINPSQSNTSTSTASAGNHSHSISGNVDNAGVSGTGQNMPPFIVAGNWFIKY